MAFNADARNKYEDPNNNLFIETVERKTNWRTAFNTVTVRQFERCTYTASLERYSARGCLVQPAPLIRLLEYPELLLCMVLMVRYTLRS